MSTVPPAEAETVGDTENGPITAMITWSHAESTTEATRARQEDVLGLGHTLRSNGIDVEIDLYHLHEAVDWTRWGPRMIADVDFVLIVVSAAWREAWEGRGDPTRGAGAHAEANALRTLETRDRTKFLRRVRLLLLPGTDPGLIPDGLHGVPRHHLENVSSEGVRGLLRDLTGQAEHVKPPLGAVPLLPPSVSSTASPHASTMGAARPAPEEGRLTATPAAPMPQNATSAPEQAAPLAHGVLEQPVDLSWRFNWSFSRSTEAILSVHVVPVPTQPLPARALASVSATLPQRLRQAQVIDATSGLEIQDDPVGVTLHFPPDTRYLEGVRAGSLRGVRIDRNGQVSAWHTLPADNMGSIIDPKHMPSIIATCLRLIGITGSVNTADIAIGAELDPLIMVSEAPIEELGRRSSATIASSSGPLHIEPDESVEVSALAAGAEEAAIDLTAVLMRNWRRPSRA